jgi:ADP-ribose pyrophosphatase
MGRSPETFAWDAPHPGRCGVLAGMTAVAGSEPWGGAEAAVPRRGGERRLLGNGEEALSLGAIKTVSSREVYRNPWTRVREDVIERANGQRGIYGVVDKDPACIVIALDRTPEGDFVYLVEQFRYTVGGRFLEIPQGGWELAEVVPEELARGELREETGLLAARMTRLATLQIAYGVMNQQQHVFLAEGLSQGEHDRDAEESDLEVHRVSVADFEAMVLDGRVVDNCSVAAWAVYRLWRERHPRSERHTTGA